MSGFAAGQSITPSRAGISACWIHSRTLLTYRVSFTLRPHFIHSNTMASTPIIWWRCSYVRAMQFTVTTIQQRGKYLCSTIYDEDVHLAELCHSPSQTFHHGKYIGSPIIWWRCSFGQAMPFTCHKHFNMASTRALPLYDEDVHLTELCHSPVTKLRNCSSGCFSFPWSHPISLAMWLIWLLSCYHLFLCESPSALKTVFLMALEIKWGWYFDHVSGSKCDNSVGLEWSRITCDDWWWLSWLQT